MKNRRLKRHAGISWHRWYVGIWWWPVKKDLGFGLELGPLYVYWTRMGPE